MQPVVELSEVVVLLDRFPALAGADLVVDRSEILWLSGPNGAGKTTLLRLCAGLLAPAEGTARVLGFDLSRDRRPLRSAVGLLGQDHGLYEDLGVAENLAFWSRAAGGDPAGVAAALDRVELPERVRELPVCSLSTGQQRRAALANLLLRRASLWLLDEPHSGLDAAGRELLDGLIREVSSLGVTVVVASHESARVEALATRMVTVRGGVVES
jgi:heme ABC exporter ATP-binding subunit CcmA